MKSIFLLCWLVFLISCNREDQVSRQIPYFPSKAIWVPEEGTNFGTLSFLLDKGFEVFVVPSSAESLIKSGGKSEKAALFPCMLSVKENQLDNEGFWVLKDKFEDYGCIVNGVLLEEMEGSKDKICKLRSLIPDFVVLGMYVGEDLPGKDEFNDFKDCFDFFLYHVYGQFPNERKDRPGMWDFKEVEKKVRRADELGKDFYTELVTLGTLRFMNQNEVVYSTTHAKFADFTWNFSLKPRVEEFFRKKNRMLLSFYANQATEVLDRKLREGDLLEFSGTAPNYLAEYVLMSKVWDLKNYRGFFLRRIPSVKEEVSLTVESIGITSTGKEIFPEIYIKVRTVVISGNIAKLEVSLKNSNENFTDYAVSAFNFIELSIDRGVFRKIDKGDFFGYEPLKRKRDELIPAAFDANVLRLYAPFIDKFIELKSGSIEIDPSNARVTVQAKFLVPGGRVMVVKPHYFLEDEWIAAELERRK